MACTRFAPLHWPMGIVLASWLALAANSTPAIAQSDKEEQADVSERGNFAFGASVGTMGVGGEIAMRVHPNFVLRATGSSWALSQYLPLGSDTSFVVAGTLPGQ